jgi:Ferritin-like domain
LEYLESAFYGQALKKAGLSGRLERFGRTVNSHEATHVATLRKVLGSKAVKRPSFDFKGTTSSPGAFTATAILLEDTGVMAYQGQAANIRSQTVFKAAISIHPVEAPRGLDPRHRRAVARAGLVHPGQDHEPDPRRGRRHGLHQVVAAGGGGDVSRRHRAARYSAAT